MLEASLAMEAGDPKAADRLAEAQEVRGGLYRACESVALCK